jgi:hypothetical protein
MPAVTIAVIALSQLRVPLCETISHHVAPPSSVFAPKLFSSVNLFQVLLFFIVQL